MVFNFRFKSTFIFISLFTLFLCSCASHQQNAMPKTSPQVTRDFKQLTNTGFIAVITTDDQWKFVLPVDYFFTPDSTNFKSDTTWVLDTIADALRQSPYQYVYVFVYTDNVGSKAQQLDRSYWQAFNIASYLWAQDIPQSIRGRGKGKKPIVASNQTVRGSGYNRRIEIINTNELLDETVGFKGFRH